MDYLLRSAPFRLSHDTKIFLVAPFFCLAQMHLPNHPVDRICVAVYGELATDASGPAPGYTSQPTISMLFGKKGRRGLRRSRAHRKCEQRSAFKKTICYVTSIRLFFLLYSKPYTNLIRGLTKIVYSCTGGSTPEEGTTGSVDDGASALDSAASSATSTTGDCCFAVCQSARQSPICTRQRLCRVPHTAKSTRQTVIGKGPLWSSVIFFGRLPS